MSSDNEIAVARINTGFIWANACSIASSIGAAVLAHHGQDGWGWLIFLAVLTHTSTLKVEVKR